MKHTAANVIKLSDYRTPPPKPKRVRQKSLSQQYPLSFFNRKKYWNVEPTGDHRTDFKTGSDAADEFLNSYDGIGGWASLMPFIVSDMVCAGTHGTWGNGEPKVNAIVLGFTIRIGHALARAQARMGRI